MTGGRRARVEERRSAHRATASAARLHAPLRGGRDARAVLERERVAQCRNGGQLRERGKGGRWAAGAAVLCPARPTWAGACVRIEDMQEGHATRDYIHVYVRRDIHTLMREAGVWSPCDAMPRDATSASGRAGVARDARGRDFEMSV